MIASIGLKTCLYAASQKTFEAPGKFEIKGGVGKIVAACRAQKQQTGKDSGKVTMESLVA